LRKFAELPLLLRCFSFLARHSGVGSGVLGSLSEEHSLPRCTRALRSEHVLHPTLSFAPLAPLTSSSGLGAPPQRSICLPLSLARVARVFRVPLPPHLHTLTHFVPWKHGREFCFPLCQDLWPHTAPSALLACRYDTQGVLRLRCEAKHQFLGGDSFRENRRNSRFRPDPFAEARWPGEEPVLRSGRTLMSWQGPSCTCT
jgi:hypothetical protein